MHKEFSVLCLITIGVCATVNLTTYDRQNTNASRAQNEIVKNNELIQRIMQPLEETRISQQLISTRANASINQKNNSSLGDFRPSPQVDTYFEHNQFPVVPALPEAKFFSNVVNNHPPLPENRPWMDKPTILKLPPRQPAWGNKISFPTTQASYLPLGNQPYPFVVESSFQETTTGRTQFPYAVETGPADVGSKNQYFAMNGANYESSTRNSNNDNQQNYMRFGSMIGYDSTTGNPNYNSISSYTRFGVTQPGNSEAGNKFGDVFSNKGNFFGSSSGAGVANTGETVYLHKTHYEQPHGMMPQEGQMQSPWKKVIKFLSAAIPIGLLLSALTPTIINVSPVNSSQIRGRALDSELSTKRLVLSLNHINKLNAAGCEERVICELLLGAGSSNNSKKYTDELIKTFRKQENPEQLEELQVIFKAVQTGTCKSLNCTNIEDDEDIVAEEDSILEDDS